VVPESLQASAQPKVLVSAHCFCRATGSGSISPDSDVGPGPPVAKTPRHITLAFFDGPVRGGAEDWMQ
jgi:hypothetical protein